jgi:hypothetical protein
MHMSVKMAPPGQLLRLRLVGPCVLMAIAACILRYGDAFHMTISKYEMLIIIHVTAVFYMQTWHSIICTLGSFDYSFSV